MAVLGALALAAPAAAQDYVTTAWVNLRQRPSASGAKLATLPPDDTLAKRTAKLHAGWVAVRTSDGVAGWVMESKVRGLQPVADTTSTVTTPPATTTPSNPGTSTTTGGAASTRIDPTWSKQPIDTATIRVQGNSLSCSPIGDGSDDGTNLHKNRNDVPGATHAITVDAIRSLPDTALWRFTNRQHWTAADSALVIPYEGIPVTVEGYFEIVKPQATSAPSGGKKVGESTNCHSWAELDTDWHMALVNDPSETEERSVVVEVTPRSKRRNAAWTPVKAQALAVRKTPSAPRNEAGAAKVRVTGFLLLDPVHPTHIRGKCTSGCSAKTFYRATLWEVHPVTRIEVWRNGAWVDLDSLP